MIGVIANDDEKPIVEEFFELFKTPWEFYQPGQRYDAIVATGDEIPPLKTKLLVVYGSAPRSTDACTGIVGCSRRRGASLDYQGTRLPIYGNLLTFEDRAPSPAIVMAGSGMAGLRVPSDNFTLLRLGYDLFQEVRLLLSDGQPFENGHIPALDIHIAMLRDWIIRAGIPLLEIPPAPAGHRFAVCLTHDIDFVGIRNHKLDHTMWGFLSRSTFGSIHNFIRGRISLTCLLKTWRAAASLPFVYLGWAKDFWEPFDWYLQVEKNLPATYYLIPFKKRPGEKVPGRNPSWRAAAYDVSDLPQQTATLTKEGCELGVHGIDAWHSVKKGRDELARLATVSCGSRIGIRMHWLLRDQNTFRVLEEAGFAYDASVGYNQTIGYWCGTAQVFRPLGADTLLELPLHIQDGALFYPQKLDLSEPEAWGRCSELLENAKNYGGVFTVLWHDRSHGPERFWGDFYIRLVDAMRSLDCWFGTATQVTEWFRKRRLVRFEQTKAPDGSTRTHVAYDGKEILPHLKVRVFRPAGGVEDRGARNQINANIVDFPWDGQANEEMDRFLRELWGRFEEQPGVANPREDNETLSQKVQPKRSLR
jgi:hypothetical protein